MPAGTTPRQVFAAARSGDARGQAIVHRLARSLARDTVFRRVTGVGRTTVDR
ncbi:hypothetical protein NUM_04900 [Actinocatenispora comari]|uniref:Uncharacterized protein n=1 Tax=Actinocatenispora comari TaxID=2807577 RepID=A0A8J4A8G2_9ACTN|nr:hypothetical protein NUM_04900 [Actinocatenispora comari]